MQRKNYDDRRFSLRDLSIFLTSAVQDRLVNYASEAPDTLEHFASLRREQKKAAALLQHFSSIANLGRASVQDLSPFLPRD